MSSANVPISSASARSEYLSAVRTFCSTISTLLPESARRRSSCITSCTMIGLRPIDGSSISNTSGRTSNARPISSCFCSPPDSDAARELMRSRSRGNCSKTSSIRSFSTLPDSCKPPSSRLCSTDNEPNKLRPWGTYAMPSLSNWRGVRPLMTLPAMRTSPERGVSMPNRVFSTVDLPAPLGPISNVISPFRTSSVNSFRMVRWV